MFLGRLRYAFFASKPHHPREVSISLLVLHGALMPGCFDRRQLDFLPLPRKC
jgi:hypothetical protein